MIVESLRVGPLEANCYVIGCERTSLGAIIDPGAEPERIIDAVERLGLDVRLMINTHGHVDHVSANADVREATGARLVIHAADREMIEHPHPFWASLAGGCEPSSPDAELAEGDELQIGDLRARVLHTPGHSPGGVCLLVDDALFTGDTLFAGSIGRTDLPGGSMEQLQQSLRRLREEIEPHVTIYPGHGASSSMGDEMRTNPYLQQL